MAESASCGDSYPIEGYINLMRALEGPSESLPDPKVDDDEMRDASRANMFANPSPTKKRKVRPTNGLNDSDTINRAHATTKIDTHHKSRQQIGQPYRRDVQQRARPFKSSPILKTIVSDISLADMMRHSFSEVAEQAGDDTQKIVTQEYWANSNFGGISRNHIAQGRGLDEKTLGQQSMEVSHDDLPQQLDVDLDPPSSNVDSDEILTDPADHQSDRTVETPATRGKKRNSKGEVIKSDVRTSATKTPGSAVNKMFAGVTSGVHMSLTQVFQNTQAATSPFGGLKSDPVFERPSPKPNLQGSSPPAPFPFTSPKSAPDYTPLKAGPPTDPIMISDEDSDSDVSIDGEPATVVKSIRTAIQVPMTSSRNKPSTISNERTQSSPIKDIDSTKIKGTPEVGLKFTNGNGGSYGTQHTDRITDSQYDSQSGHMKPPPRIPTSSVLSDPHISQSPYSQSMPVDLSKLGAETQKAVTTSSPPHPPFVPSADGDQARMPSSPPIIRSAAHSTKEQQNQDEEDEDLSSQEEVNLITALFVQNHNDNTLGTRGRPSYEDLHNQDKTALQESEQTSRDETLKMRGVGDLGSTPGLVQVHQRSTSLGDLQESEKEHNRSTQQSSRVKDNSTSAYQTAQTHMNSSHSVPEASQNTSHQTLPVVNPRKRLADIAAEPSQEAVNDVNLDFTIMESSRDDLELQKLSSPVRPTSRFKRQKKYSEAAFRGSPSESNSGRLRNGINSKTQNSLEKPRDREFAVEVSTPPSPEDMIEHGLVVSDNIMGNSKRKPMLGKLKRPEKFLKQIARISKKSATSRRKSDIFEPEETQLSNSADSQSLQTDIADVQTSISGDEDFIIDLSSEPVLFPSRILAYCRAPYNACYPATVQKVFSRPSGPKMDVIFDDGSSAVLDADKWIFKLNFRVGDMVRVDLPRMKKNKYVVCGFKDKISCSGEDIVEGEGPIGTSIKSTDIYGYQTVRVALRARESGSTAAQISSTTTDVPIWAVKIDQWEFRKFEDDRNYQAMALTMPSTPMETPQYFPHRLESPPSRSHRQTLSGDGHDDAVLNSRPTSGVFTNMAFAVTFSFVRDDDKFDCIQRIKSNGGRLLDSGFEELFQCPPSKGSTPATAGTPASSPAPTTAGVGGDLLQLSTAARELGFTALIADTHSRRAKHMQALALNLPILHFRWITDCVAAKCILPWSKYLLPAGESTYLGGAVRSSTLMPYDPLSSSASLSHVLSQRALLFADKTVLFITGKGKAEERRKAYSFLTMALGAKKLSKVRDLGEAKTKLGRENWDCVYVDGEVERGEQVLGDGEWRVVHDEFVVQTLILGAFPE